MSQYSGPNNQVQNPYGKGSSGAVPKNGLPIASRKCKCVRREKWIKEEGTDWIEVVQDDRSCIMTWFYDRKYEIKSGGHEIGEIKEKSTCCCKFLCSQRARAGESHLKIQNEEYVATKSWNLGYVPGCATFTCSNSCLPNMNVTNKSGQTIGFIVQRWFPNCQGQVVLDCYSGQDKGSAKFLFTVSESKCGCIVCDCFPMQRCLGHIYCFCCCECSCLSFCWSKKRYWSFDKGFNSVCNSAPAKHAPAIWQEWNKLDLCKVTGTKYQVRLPEGDLDTQAIFLHALHLVDHLKSGPV